MIELGIIYSPSLPGWALYSVAFLSALAILVVMTRSGSRAGSFVIGAAWLRNVMQAMHSVTYRPLMAGMSANAVVSILMVGVGLLAINWRHLALRAMVPFYVLVALTLTSAVANGDIGPGLITVLSKHGYLIVITLSVYAAMKKNAEGGDFMTSFLWAFVPVLIFQALSVVLGVSKHTELDSNANSYIGGFNHEAVFSVILATALTVACFTTRLNKYLKYGIIIACIGGIVLANYRTTLVAIAPLLLMFFGFSSLARFPFRDRPAVISVLIVLVGLSLGVVSLMFAERFSDVATATSGHVNFFKPADQYTVEESRLLSGRPRIWSMYIYGWLAGDLSQHIIGFGPESWSSIFPLYAHNTLISYLYEYGVIGVVCILFLWCSMLMAALRVKHGHRGILIGAHLSWIMLNMSTMPMWMIEGNMLYGVICGYTLYLLSLNKQAKPRRGVVPARA